MRSAVYFVPPPGHPLTEAAARWLGRDVYRNAARPRPSAGFLTEEDGLRLTAEPRRYGFHATLKPPFRIAEPFALAQVEAAAEAFGRSFAPLPLGRLRIERIGPFFALVPAEPHHEIDDLAAAAVRWFDRYRAPPPPSETARRKPESLTARQQSLLTVWGYPYVFDEFRFHMTLTGPVPEDQRAAARVALEQHFAPMLDEPLALDAIALVVEPEPGTPFTVHSRQALRRAIRPVNVA